jgi:ADP-ribose pyrophosphatase YjhB (NUDIX family)
MDIPEFGIKRENEERRDGGCGVVFDPETQLYAVGKDANGWLRLFSGGLNPGEDTKDGVFREVREESGLFDFLYTEKIAEALCHFHNTLKNVDRVAHATCFLIVLKSAKLIPTQLEAHEKFVLVWKNPEDIIKNWEDRNQNKDYDHWIYFFKKSINRLEELGYVK